MVLITFAVPHESRAFRRVCKDDTVRVLHTGIGCDAAASALRKVFAADPPSIVISSGFAGALDPRLQVGDLVSDDLYSDRQLLTRLPSEGFRGRIHTAERAIDTAAAKAQLHRETGALAVDMETTGIVQECTRAAIPLLILRAISDAATDSIPVPLPIAWSLDRQRPRPFRLLSWLAAHPSQIREFIRFLRGTQQASRRLAEVLPAVAAACRSQQLA